MVLVHLVLALLASSTSSQPTRPVEGSGCSTWRGTASGNDPSVALTVTLCEKDARVAGMLEWRSDRSGTSRRTLDGVRQGGELVLRDVELTGTPNKGWRFCPIDEYRLTNPSADSLTGSYVSSACHDRATLELARVH